MNAKYREFFRLRQHSESLIARQLWRFIPLQFISGLSVAILSMADGILAGRLLGAEALAATQFAQPFTLLLGAAFDLLSVGLAANIAAYFGKNHVHMLARWYRCARFLLAAGGASVLLFQFPVAWLLLRVYRLNPTLHALAFQYLLGLMCGTVFSFFNLLGASLLHACGRARLVLLEALLENLLNIAANLLLIRGFGLGLLGAGLGSALAMFARALLTFHHLRRNTLLFHARSLRPEPEMLKRVVRSGWQEGFQMLSLAVQDGFLLWLAHAVLGVYGAGVKAILGFCWLVVQLFLNTVNGTALPLYGLYAELEDRKNGDRARVRSLWISVAGASVLALVFCLFPYVLPLAYGVPELGGGAARAIRCFALYFLGSAIALGVKTWYEGTRRRRRALLVLLLWGPLLQLPVGLLLRYSGAEIWWTGPIAACAAALAALLLVRRDGRKEPDTHMALDLSLRPGDASDVSESVSAFLSEHALPPRYANRICLVLEELIASVRGMNGAEVLLDVSVHFFQDHCVIALMDNGESRNLAEAIQTLQDDDPSMSGEFLISRVAQSLHYQWAFGINITTVQVNLALENPQDVDSGRFPYYSQQDHRWRYQKYGSSTVGESGCGPTCLAMACSGLLRRELIPPEVAEFSENSGWYLPGLGTSWELMDAGARKLGLEATYCEPDEKVLTEALRAGCCAICAMTPGDFTREGHFIFLPGLTENGKIAVYDPNSVLRSKSAWPAAVLVGQMRGMWTYSASPDAAVKHK